MWAYTGPYHLQRWTHPQYFAEKSQIHALESSLQMCNGSCYGTIKLMKHVAMNGCYVL